MMKKILFIFIFLSFIICPNLTFINAQITIGSKEKPSEGALLQLKEIDGVTDGGINSKRGMLLPRVALEELSSLKPCAEDNAVNTQKHIGLIVYNTTTTNELCTGLHVWDGANWNPVKQKISATNTYVGDEESNSFIIPSEYAVEIPITKAYDVWETSLGYGANYLSRNKADISFEFLWQDRKDIYNIAQLVVDENNPRNSKIRLEPACPSVNTLRTGNVIVGVRIKKADGTEDVIRWSWHLWVSNFNPETSTADLGSFTWMDRNLGATNKTPGDLGSFGLYYQWGRKDPFPNIREIKEEATKGSEIDVYDLYNNIIHVKVSEVALPNNIENAIQTPNSFYINPANNPHSWYTSTNTLKLPTLWGSTDAIGGSSVAAKKSIYDPCPKGWRVPIYKNWTSPWAPLLRNNVQWSIPTAGGLASGCSWPNFNTYLPLTGSWYPQTADVAGASNAGNIWSGSMNGSGFAVYLRFVRKPNENGFVDPVGAIEDGFAISNGQHTAHGFPVRCVKEFYP